MSDDVKRFRLDVDLDWSTMTCPCGASCRTDAHNYAAWERKHTPHTQDGGASLEEVNAPEAWGKCFAGPCPPPRVRQVKP